MNKILSFITGGFTTIADAYVQPRTYIHPSRAGFQKDQAKLRGDVRKVGQGMKTVIAAQNGKQPNKS